MCFFSNSFTSACTTVANILTKNITKWTRTATTTTRPNCIRRLYYCLRCHTGTVCPVTLPQSMLFAGLRHSIFIRCQTIACTCNTWTVSGKLIHIFIITTRQCRIRTTLTQILCFSTDEKVYIFRPLVCIHSEFPSSNYLMCVFSSFHLNAMHAFMHLWPYAELNM